MIELIGSKKKSWFSCFHLEPLNGLCCPYQGGNPSSQNRFSRFHCLNKILVGMSDICQIRSYHLVSGKAGELMIPHLGRNPRPCISKNTWQNT
jgi:hypothetical protein